MSRIATAAATHTGYLRTTNQDIALATSDLAAVADGMGGHVGGEIAARIAVEHLLEAYRRDRTTEGLLAAVRDANEAIYQRSRSDRNLRGMGTTLTAVAVVGEESDGRVRLALVNVGDSRGYLLDRPEKRIQKLTDDHSVVEEMVRSGELTADEAAVHPHKHILTRVLGVELSLDVDCWELDLDPGSRLLLCSDGLTNELGEQEIANVLAEKADLETAANELVRLALQRGGIDNVTVVVLDVIAGEVAASPDDVVLLPEEVGGMPGAPVAGESDAITEAVALTESATPPIAASCRGSPRGECLSGGANRRQAVSPERTRCLATGRAGHRTGTGPGSPAAARAAKEEEPQGARRQDRHSSRRALCAGFCRRPRRCRRGRHLVRQGFVLCRARSGVCSDLPGPSRRDAVVQALCRRAHDAQAVRAARLQRRESATGNGGELVSSCPQFGARPVTRALPGRSQRGRHHDDSPVAVTTTTVGGAVTTTSGAFTTTTVTTTTAPGLTTTTSAPPVVTVTTVVPGKTSPGVGGGNGATTTTVTSPSTSTTTAPSLATTTTAAK